MNYRGGVPKPKENGPDEKCLKRGTEIEAAEHPWAGKMVARRIAEDHLREDPEYYEGEEEEGEESEGEDEETGKSLSSIVKED